MKNIPNPLRMLALLAGGLLCTHLAHAQNVWIGVSGTSATTNWSDTANWSMAASPAFTDVLFGDLGAAAAAGTINSVVDTSGLDPASMTFTNMSQNSLFHTILIPSGLTLANPGTLSVGGSSLPTVTTKVNFAGGGTFVQSGATMNVKWIGGTAGGSLATLDLSGLNNFVYESSGGAIVIASAPSGSEARGGGVLTLAGVSNSITASTISVALGTGNGGTGGTLNLGAGTNVINVGAVNAAAGKINNGTITFLGTTGGLRLRGTGGTDSDRANFTLGRRGNTGTGTINGRLLLNGHPVDILADTMALGQSTANQSGQTVNGVLQFNTGTIDANNINLAVCSGNAGAIANGTVTVGGGRLIVNGNFSLVNQTLGTATGILNITNGGLVICSNNLVKTTTAGTGNVSIDGGGLRVVGTIGSVSAPINNFNLANASLTLGAATSAKAIVTTLNCGGTANTINISEVPVVSSYPAQFALIQYAGTLSGTFNIGVGTLPASSPAYSGFISNNVANMSIDLVLTAGKLPARSVAWSGATDGNWDTTTANWLFSGSPTTYHEEDFVRLDDTATGSTTVILTATRMPSSVTVSNQTKAYTFSGSGNLSGATGITKDGAAKLTIANSGINDNTGGLTIQAGTVQVGDGSFAGNLGSGNIANDGSLIFARGDGVTVADTISGTGGLTQNGAGGTLTLNAANTYTGNTTVSQGTLQVGNAAALGTTDAGTTVASGATLDFNGRNIGLEPVTVLGAGVSGAGALVNNGADIYPSVAFVTMTGNTVFGGSGRWDLRSSTIGNPNLSSLLTGGQPYKLTKVGANSISIVGATVDPALGDVEIQGGTLGLEAATTSLGNSESNLTVWPGAQLKFYNLTNHLNKKIYLGSDLAFPSLRSDSGDNFIAGPIVMTNDCTFTFDSGTSLALEGPLSGGLLSMSGGGNLIIGGAATHAGTVVGVGKLVLNGTHSGGITNTAGTSFAGRGINTGFSDVGGALLPGDTNLVGTLTLSGLLLQFGAEVFLDLGPTTTVGGSANDLVQVNGDLTINGNSLTVNPQGPLLKGAGNPYTVIKYTGNLIENSPLSVTGPNNYTFTVDTTVPHEIRLVASGGPPVWNGGSALTSNWSDSANWGGIAVAYGDSLYFGGSARLNNINDTTAGNLFNNLAFVAGAGAFTLNGNSINLGGSIVNGSVNTQTVNLNLSLGAANAFSGTSGTLVVGGDVTNTVNLTTLTLSGTGILSNRLASADVNTITNILLLNSASADWTLMDNPSSTPVVIPLQLDIQAGTLNFGEGSSAPVLTSTTPNGTPSGDTRVGNVGGAAGTLNMVNGTLTVAARLNTGTAGGATGIVNQVGGTLNVGSQLQGANGAATAVSFINVSGGTMNIQDTALRQLYVASRGLGFLNVSGTALINCSTLDVSRSINSGIAGTVNLDGGTLAVGRVGTGTANSGSATTGSTGSVNFNGGTLKANASSATWFQGRASGPTVPLTAIVKAGGAIIDSDTYAISFLEPLQHDSDLGGTPDGGLKKEGTGTLTLTAANTYTGDTLVNNGTLSVNGSLAATTVTVASGATLAGTGSLGGSATVKAGGTVAPGVPAAIGTLTLVGNATLRGTAAMKLNKGAGAATNDVLSAAAIDLGGSLVVSNVGPLLQTGDAFTLFRGTLSASITPASLPPLWPGLSWNTSSLNTLGRISVTGTTVPPAVTGTGVASGSFTLSGSGGLAGATYYVLASTNAALPLASWTRVETNVFDGSGNFTFTKAADQPRQFFVIQAP